MRSNFHDLVPCSYLPGKILFSHCNPTKRHVQQELPPSPQQSQFLPCSSHVHYSTSIQCYNYVYSFSEYLSNAYHVSKTVLDNCWTMFSKNSLSP